MTDVVSSAVRSRIMSRIRGKDTRPELLLRRALHARGLRFRLHAGNLPGRPDLVFPRHRAVIFVHGCFWHRHEGCPKATVPATRPEFWANKFAANIARDRRQVEDLLAAGWRVGTVWECALPKKDISPELLDEVELFIRGTKAQTASWPLLSRDSSRFRSAP